MRYAILFMLMVVFPYAQAQLPIWGASTQSDFTNESTALAFDADNNLYVTGYITGECAFNANVTFNSAQGNGDIFVAKYSPLGALIWVKKFGGSMSDRAYDIRVDNNGDVIVSGQFFGTVNFGGQTVQSVSNSKDIFVIKMNPQGDVIWAISEGGSLGDNMYALAIDQQNNIILTGQFAGLATIAGQTLNSMVNPDLNQPSYDIFVSKYNSNGTPIWVLHGSAKYEDRGMALATDNQNNIYLAGQFSDTLLFAGQTYNNTGYNIGYLTKLNPNGQVQWFNRMTAGLVLPYDIVVGSDNLISVCGDYMGNFSHHATNGVQTINHDFSKKIFVSTVNATGQVQWQRALGSDSELSARGIARDNNNQIYVTGHFRCALTELHQGNTALFNSVGFRDIFLWTLNISGTSLQTKQMGGKKNDYAYDIQVNSFGQPYICGSYMNTLFVPYGQNVATNNQNSYNLNGNSPYYNLSGDESSNAFVSGALNLGTSNYNYFNGQPNDSLIGYISLSDTVFFCDQGQLVYQHLTHVNGGPGYNYLWNTSQTTQQINVNQSGQYSVYVERWDGCVSNYDTVEVIVNITPQMPLLSDDIIQYTDATLGACNQNSTAVNIHLCAPDSAMIWFSPIDPNLTFSITGPQTNINDTDPHVYSEQGVYTAVISSPFCSRTRCFKVTHDQVLDKIIDPKPLFVDPNIINDTLTICAGQGTPVNIIDLLTNPQQDAWILPTTPVVTENFAFTVNGNQVTHIQYPLYPQPATRYRAKFYPTTTGWYILNYQLITGYNNTCGMDTMYNQRFDSLYIIVNPLPNANTNLQLSSLLCPNGSVYITSSNSFPNFSWSGPSIDWTSTNNDSVQVSASGIYSYSGTIVDPITGCTKFFTFQILLNQKLPPNIDTNPSDAIVCPYDSVLMSVPNIYVSYNWTGPSGTNLSFSNTHYDAEMGFYYCTVLDDEGCYLTTPPLEIQEFSTPYLFVEPSLVICPGQQVEISAVFIGNGEVNWLPPLSGSGMTQTVNTPGWYAAELTACGITVIDSVHILDGGFTPIISATDTLLCANQNIVISGNIPSAYYIWSNGVDGLNNIQVSNEGTFSASVTNDFGCSAQTNEITITFASGSSAPNSYILNLCTPSQETLTTNQNIAALWFDENMNPLDSAFTYTQLFSNSTTIYMAYPQDYCPLVYGTATINLIPSIPEDLIILGDDLLCYHDSAIYTVNWTGNIEWLLNGNVISNQNSISLQADNLLTVNTLIANLSNSCYSLSVEYQIVVQQQSSLIPSFYDTIVCPFTSVLLDFDPSINTLFSLDNTPTISNNSAMIFAENQPMQLQFYAMDVNNCLTDTITVEIDVHVSNFSILEVFIPVCTPDTLIMTTNANAEVNWEVGQSTYYSDTLSLLIMDAGVYSIAASYIDSLGCFHSAEHYITIFNPNTYNLPDTIVCIGQTIYTAFQYSYDNGPIFTPIDSIQIMNSQTVSYVVYNSFGCPFTGSFQVEAINCTPGYPNVITPNGDGVNDIFVIRTAPLEPNNVLVILNRWGAVIFEENGYKNTFNGSNCIDGVYFYEYTPNSLNPNVDVVRGFLHIIR